VLDSAASRSGSSTSEAKPAPAFGESSLAASGGKA
jgi:hypothetical protein